MYLAIETARAQKRWIKRFRDIRCANGQDWLGLNTAMIQAKKAKNFFEPTGLHVRRIHLHQQFVEATCTTHSTKNAAAHRHCPTTTGGAGHTYGIELVHENHATAIFTCKAACLLVEPLDHQYVHTNEHGSEAGSTGIRKRYSCLGTHTLCQVTFTSSWRAREQQAAYRGTTHFFEFFGTFQQCHDALGGFQDFRITFIVIKPYACLAWHDPVESRAT